MNMLSRTRSTPAASPAATLGDAAIALLNAQDLVDHLSLSVFLFRLGAQGRYVCRIANIAFETLFGLERHHIIGLGVNDLPGLRGGQPFAQHFDLCVESRKPVVFEWVRAQAPDERYYVCHLTPVLDSEGEVTELIGTIADQSTERAAERRMLYDAQHEHLTGLPNRGLFHEFIDQAVERAARHPESDCAVLVLNIDRFHQINESLGHVAGDEFLIALAKRLHGCLRSGDRLACFKGDEFGILMESMTGIAEAEALADDIHAALRAPFNMGGHKVCITASIGIATTRTSGLKGEDLARDADFAMHRAKHGGKARSETYHSEVHQQMRTRFELEVDLRRALEQNALTLHYQPIVDLADGHLVGFEALARWHHPRRGFISPVQFIPIAEETGLIVPLGRWALKTACAQLATWRNTLGAIAQGLDVSVNVSGIQLSRDDIVDAVHEALHLARLDGAALRVELTETALVDNPDASAKILRELKLLGVRLALDDFGTGYSSLSYLQRFPFDVLKIDRGFIRDIEHGGENFKLVEIMVMLAQRLGMKMVAEGIESPAQIAVLQRLGCSFGQGFHYAKPLDADAAEAYILAHAQVVR